MKRRIGMWLTLVLALSLGVGTSQARYLNPATGRFQTMDSYEGRKSKPSSLHKYVYAESDPFNRVDPSGHGADTGTLPGISVSTLVYVSLAALTAYTICKLVRDLPMPSFPDIFDGTSTSTVGDVLPAPAPQPEPQPKPWPAPVPVPIERHDDEPVLIISKTLSKMPAIAQHIQNAQERSAMAPNWGPRLHKGLGTEDFRNNQRRLALRGLGKPPTGRSWDEYPFASTTEGGADTSIEPVPIQEQKVQGGVINAFYQSHGLVYGDAFWVLIVP